MSCDVLLFWPCTGKICKLRKTNCYVWISTNLDRLDIFEDEEALPSGYVLLLIQYDRAALYMGEIAGIHSLKQQYSRLPLFTGKCPTKNLFSILDKEVDNEDYNDIESIYKD